MKFSTPPVLTFGQLGLTHCLGTVGIPVLTASEKDNHSTASYSRYSRKHFTFTSFSSPNFVDELCRLGKSLADKIVLMGHDDRALLTISRNRERLKKYFLFKLPEKDIVDKLLDKLLFCQLCEDFDLPAPASIELSETDQLSEVPEKLDPPFIIKPAYRHYWYDENFKEVVGTYKKAFICQSFDELESLYHKIAQIHPSVVVQEYVKGSDDQMYDINLYADEDGEINAYTIGQKMRVYPPQAGWGTYVKTVDDEEMLSICADIINKLELKGLLNIQFKKDERTGDPKLIEIHVRTSIFDFLGATAGQNIPVKYYEGVTEANIEESGSYKTNIAYLNLARDLRLFMRYRNEYEMSYMDWIKTYRNVSVVDGMLIKDPKAMYHELRSVLTRG